MEIGPNKVSQQPLSREGSQRLQRKFVPKQYSKRNLYAFLAHVYLTVGELLDHAGLCLGWGNAPSGADEGVGGV